MKGRKLSIIKFDFNLVTCLLLPSIILFVCFFSFYFSLANQIGQSAIYQQITNFIEFDSQRVIKDIAVFSTDHFRTEVHPIFLLLVNLPGSLLTLITNSSQLSAQIIIVFAGSLCVALSYILFFIIGKNKINAFLLSIMFGFSSAQIIFSSIPESSSISALSLMPTYFVFLLSLKRKKVNFLYWSIAGICAFGITATNFIQTIICYMVALISMKSPLSKKDLIFKFTNFAGFCILVAAVLSLIQKVIYPYSSIFFLPSAQMDERHFMSLLIFQRPFLVLLEVVKSLFLMNVSSPLPNLNLYHGVVYPFATFLFSWNYSTYAWVGIGLLIFLYFLAIYKLFHIRDEYRPFFIGIGACIAFNFIFHCFYGVMMDEIELYLYCGNFTFLLFCLFAPLTFEKSNLLRILIILEAALLLYTNLSFFTDIKNIYTENEPSMVSYRFQLQLLYNRSGIPAPSTANYFLFGMGPRRKMIYENGVLKDLYTGKVVKSWKVINEKIIPPDYEVKITADNNRTVKIFEDEKGIWINEDGKDQLISGGEVNLPDFSGYTYSSILKVLNQEILIDITNGEPLPNLLTYTSPRYRDAAMMCMSLQKTGNIGLVKNWIEGLSEPYDMQSGVAEPDNLGEALYMISLVSNADDPLVPKILTQANRITIDNSLTGLTDGAEHPVYQTAWMKFGLDSLGLEDDYVLPNVQDTYGKLAWWLPGYVPQNQVGSLESIDYPYLSWAEDHTLGKKPAILGNLLYPLSWKSNAGKTEYSMMTEIINKTFKEERSCQPHGWTAAEMFLYLYDSGGSM
jgi:hypothetical protein